MFIVIFRYLLSLIDLNVTFDFSKFKADLAVVL